MKDFRTKFMAAGGGEVKAKMQTQAAAAPPPPKLSRRQRRMNATLSRHINEQIKKANELGQTVSLRSDSRGRLKVIRGKPKKKDPGPQPGEVITEVAGNDLPELPGLPAFPQPPHGHVHTEDCQHEEEDVFEKVDRLVEETVGR